MMRSFLLKLGLAALLGLRLTSTAFAEPIETIYIADTEGEIQGIQTYIDSGDLKFENGHLEVARPNIRVVFLGDVGDRGPQSMQARAWLNDLTSRRSPNQVSVSLMGNREANKFQFLRDLPSLEELRDPEYVKALATRYYQDMKLPIPEKIDLQNASLRAHLQPLNTRAEQVAYWLNGHSAWGGLQQHQLEMEDTRSGYIKFLLEEKSGRSHPFPPSINTEANQKEFWLQRYGSISGFEYRKGELQNIQNSPITLEEAAQNYIKACEPGGEFFEYNRNLSLISRNGDTLSVHGFLTEDNIRRVPGSDVRYDNLDEWAANLNAALSSNAAHFAHDYQNGVRGEKLSDTIPYYGDGHWEQEANGGRGVLNFNASSVIYPYRSRAGSNFRGIDAATQAYLDKNGIKYLVFGHTPSPDGPTVLNNGKSIVVMADTSMTSHGKGVQIRHIQGGGMQITWTTPDNVNVDFVVKAGDPKEMIGRVTSNGYNVVGRTKDGRYVLQKYEVILDKNGRINPFGIKRQYVSSTELAELDPKFAKPSKGDSEGKQYAAGVAEDLHRRKVRVLNMELDEHGDIIRDAKGKPVMSTIEYTLKRLSEEIGDRIPIYFSSSTKYGQIPRSPEEITAMAKNYIAEMVKLYHGAGHLACLWGGTATSGFNAEAIFIEECRKYGIPDFAGAPKDVSLSEVRASTMALVANRGAWDKAGAKLLDLVREKKGVFVPIGGGPMVTSMIDTADKLGVQIDAVSADPAFLESEYQKRLKVYDTYLKAVEAHRENPDIPMLKHMDPPNRPNGGASAVFVANHSRMGATSTDGLISNRVSKPIRIGVYTGSFDPPHLGHRAIVDEMKKKYGLDEVIVVPDSSTQYKPGMQSYENRVKMTELTFQGDPGVRVEKVPGELGQVLTQVQGSNPGADISAIMGTDTLDWLQREKVDHLPEGVSLLVNNRDSREMAPESIFRDHPVHVMRVEGPSISSTLIRQRMTAIQVDVQGLVSPEVQSYMESHSLYRPIIHAGDLASQKRVMDQYRKEGKTIFTFSNYSGAGYEKSPEQMAEEWKKDLSQLDPAKTIVETGGTEMGVGQVACIAKSMGFRTIGITSTQGLKDGVSSCVDEQFWVKDESWGGADAHGKLSPTLDLIAYSSDHYAVYGGNGVEGVQGAGGLLNQANQRQQELAEQIKQLNEEVKKATRSKSQQRSQVQDRSLQAPPACNAGNSDFGVPSAASQAKSILSICVQIQGLLH